jgi:predicted ester cyclase
MSTKDPKALERRFFTEMNKGKAAGMAATDELCATNFVFHPPTGEDIHGIKDFKQFASNLYDAFPDLHGTIDDIIVEGDKAVLRCTITGTHKGEFMGIPPTNKKATWSPIEIDRFAGGKLVESWERLDTIGFMQQLGVVPTPGKGK